MMKRFQKECIFLFDFKSKSVLPQTNWENNNKNIYMDCKIGIRSAHLHFKGGPICPTESTYLRFIKINIEHTYTKHTNTYEITHNIIHLILVLNKTFCLIFSIFPFIFSSFFHLFNEIGLFFKDVFRFDYKDFFEFNNILLNTIKHSLQ